MHKLLFPISIILALAGCGQGNSAPEPTPTPAAGGYITKVKALSAKQRAGVLLRAIRDADRPCQSVVDNVFVPNAAVPAGRSAVWLATCDDQGHWLVAIGDDGNATVTDAHDLVRNGGASTP